MLLVQKLLLKAMQLFLAIIEGLFVVSPEMFATYLEPTAALRIAFLTGGILTILCNLLGLYLIYYFSSDEPK